MVVLDIFHRSFSARCITVYNCIVTNFIVVYDFTNESLIVVDVCICL